MEFVFALLLDSANYVLVLALVAMGLVIIFGLMNVINMAHGELFLLGAYVAVVVTRELALSFWLAVALAPLLVGAVGLLLEQLVIRHVYHRFLDTILATWGISIAIKQGIVLTMGPASHTVDLPIDVSLPLFGLAYPGYRLMVMGIALAVIGGTFWLFYRTDFGLAARGVIANREMASCLGVDTRRLDRATFAFGAALAGLAGAVVAPLVSIDPAMGMGFLVPAFLAILVGGAGQLWGTLAGAGAVGGTNVVAANLWSPVVAQIVVFTMAIVVIRIFPRGIGGRKDREGAP